MNDHPAAPWNNPPERSKPLRRKRAEKLARRAEHWGRRLEEARAQGPDMVAAVAFDRLRKALDALPAGARERAFEDVVSTLDQIRERHAQ
ncbi:MULTISPECIES: hypothetical protein [unclassified Streptomyces]|uniref:hypothetical protein n=1 Tax=unclassified Streptomyces TaxID=2593676 RepID=UPI0023B8E0C4|nr:hypothetical protein [Streptomyces sp. AM 2-1-1]WEH43977.1 hypothetical protein PZB77_30920 [Streptomyces sp. AM 2-1-1]